MTIEQAELICFIVCLIGAVGFGVIWVIGKGN